MPGKVLRHFLYLDVELVGAFLEQLEGGKVRMTGNQVRLAVGTTKGQPVPSQL